MGDLQFDHQPNELAAPIDQPDTNQFREEGHRMGHAGLDIQTVLDLQEVSSLTHYHFVLACQLYAQCSTRRRPTFSLALEPGQEGLAGLLFPLESALENTGKADPFLLIKQVRAVVQTAVLIEGLARDALGAVVLCLLAEHAGGDAGCADQLGLVVGAVDAGPVAVVLVLDRAGGASVAAAVAVLAVASVAVLFLVHQVAPCADLAAEAVTDRAAHLADPAYPHFVQEGVPANGAGQVTLAPIKPIPKQAGEAHIPIVAKGAIIATIQAQPSDGPLVLPNRAARATQQAISAQPEPTRAAAADYLD
jgi:hypothetical protein